MTDPVSEVFAELMELARRLGVASVRDLPGCWEVQLDSRWWIALNGHGEPTASSRNGETVPAYHLYVEYNGWPAGVVGPYSGIVAAGAEANEGALIEALRGAGS